jgi:hypothetical protein
MRSLIVGLGLLASTPAFAGGFGLLVNGGVHTERVYFYENAIRDADGELVALEDPGEYPQFEQVQTLSNLGLGGEVILGDRDDRFIGTFQFYWMQDAAQRDPSSASTNKDSVVAAWRETPRNIGMGMVGVSWGAIGKDKVTFGPTAHVGSGFLTTDHTEFLAVDAGPTVNVRVARSLLLHADALYMARFRKGWSQGGMLAIGARYMFD